MGIEPTRRGFSPAHRIAYPMRPRLLPLKDAAEYLGLTVWAMRERIWAGQIPVVQFPESRKQLRQKNDRLLGEVLHAQIGGELFSGFIC